MPRQVAQLRSTFLRPAIPLGARFPTEKITRCCASLGSTTVKSGYRMIIVDRAGVLVSEFQLTEDGLAQPDAFVSAIKQAIEDVEEQEP